MHHRLGGNFHNYILLFQHDFHDYDYPSHRSFITAISRELNGTQYVEKFHSDSMTHLTQRSLFGGQGWLDRRPLNDVDGSFEMFMHDGDDLSVSRADDGAEKYDE